MRRITTILILAIALLTLGSAVYDIIDDYFDENCYNYAGIKSDDPRDC